MATPTASPFWHSLSFRLLGYAFLGTHIPLIGLLFWYVLGPGHDADPDEVLWVALSGTILAAGFTLVLVHMQIQPLRKAAQVLAAAKPGGSLPDLPDTDTIEIQTLFEAMREAFDRSKRLLDEKRDLITLFSHDLRSPATASLGILKILEKDDSIDAEMRSALFGKLRAASLHQIEILGNVLGMMRLDLDDAPQTEEVSLGELLAPVRERGADLAEAKGIHLEVQVAEAMVQVQPFIVRQAVENLLSNAVKFSHPGQTIVLETQLQGNDLVISVVDQGVGFTQEQGKALAQTSVRTGKLGTLGEKSNGLGLYLVERAARRHQGTLSMESPGPGQGARFSLWLPSAAVTD